MVDSLTPYYALPPMGDSIVVWQRVAVDPAQIFGTASRPTYEVLTDATALSEQMVIPISWQGAVLLLVLLVLFCYIVYRHYNSMRLSFKSALSLGNTLIAFDNPTNEFTRFLLWSRILLLSGSAMAVVGGWMDGRFDLLTAMGVVLVGIVVARSLSNSLRYIISLFDYNRIRWQKIRSVERMDTAIAAMILCLPTILLALSPSMFWILIILYAGMALYHASRILIVFKLTGFSFLQSFLYLCAVQIAPFTLVWGLGRTFSSLI